MDFNYFDSARPHRLDATVQVSLKWLCLGGSGLVFFYWFVDTYVVAPDKRLFYTFLRATISSIFLLQFFLIRRTRIQIRSATPFLFLISSDSAS